MQTIWFKNQAHISSGATLWSVFVGRTLNIGSINKIFAGFLHASVLSGWQPGIQENAAQWDDDWDKFEDEGMFNISRILLAVVPYGVLLLIL